MIDAHPIDLSLSCHFVSALSARVHIDHSILRIAELSRPTAAADADKTNSSEAPSTPLHVITNSSSSSVGRDELDVVEATRDPASPYPMATPSVNDSNSSELNGGSLRDRGIKSLLSAELEPVTEVPGEEPGGKLGETEWDVVAGQVTSSTPRPSSWKRQISRRRSGSGSRGVPGSILEDARTGVDGRGEDGEVIGDQIGVEEAVEALQEAGREVGTDDGCRDDGQPETPAGLYVELRVSAPVICVLLVHDKGDVDARTHEKLPAFASAIEEDGVSGNDAERGHVLRSSPPMHDGKHHRPEDDTCERAEMVEGALVLVEILGLEVKYQDVLGGGGGGGGADRADHNFLGTSRDNAHGSDEPVMQRLCDAKNHTPTTPHQFCLTARSYRVTDMYQQAGRSFSYLLSSTAPIPVLVNSSGDDGSQVQHAQNAVRFTYALAAKDSGGSSAVAASKAIVSLGGIWANWNPETIAALSIFAHGMYGSTPSSDGVHGSESSPEKDGEGAEGIDDYSGIAEGPSSGRSSASSSVEILSPEKAGQMGVHRTRCDRDDGKRSGGTVSKGTRYVGVIIEVQQLSLWLNKEAHGRELLLLEAGYSKVRPP